MKIEQIPLRDEAENCRRMALVYLGKPEATLLIRTAKAFEELAEQEDRSRFEWDAFAKES